MRATHASKLKLICVCSKFSTVHTHSLTHVVSLLFTHLFLCHLSVSAYICHAHYTCCCCCCCHCYDRLFQRAICIGTYTVANFIWLWHGMACVSCNNPFVFRYHSFCFVYLHIAMFPVPHLLARPLLSILATFFLLWIEHERKNVANLKPKYTPVSSAMETIAVQWW